MGSGLLDVERRVELAALELLEAWTDLTALLDSGHVIQHRNAAVTASFPGAYVEAYNMAEFGLHTGNYLGGLRVGGMTYIDDDTDKQVCLRIIGAFRSWAQQAGVTTLLNATASAVTAGSEVWFFTVEMDLDGMGGMPAYVVESTSQNRVHEGILELTVVCMPSRPN